MNNIKWTINLQYCSFSSYFFLISYKIVLIYLILSLYLGRIFLPLWNNVLFIFGNISDLSVDKFYKNLSFLVYFPPFK